MSRRYRRDPEESGPREFTNEELSEIIRIAARTQTRAPNSRISYDEMVAVGRDLGIDAATLDVAASEIMKERRAKQRRIRHKMGFMQHLAVYGVVITGLACLNLMTGSHHLWFLYPAIGWGIGVAIQGASVYFSEKEALLRQSV